MTLHGGGTRRAGKKAAGSKSANVLTIGPYPEMNVRSSGSSSYGVGPATLNPEPVNPKS
jgi:hypothetical protein